MAVHLLPSAHGLVFFSLFHNRSSLPQPESKIKIVIEHLSLQPHKFRSALSLSLLLSTVTLGLNSNLEVNMKGIYEDKMISDRNDSPRVGSLPSLAGWQPSSNTTVVTRHENENYQLADDSLAAHTWSYGPWNASRSNANIVCIVIKNTTRAV